MAIVHIAMFDSVNGIAGGFRSYTNVRPARTGASMTTAIAQAARDALTALFPSQQSTFDQFLASDLNQVHDGRAKTDGIDMGHRAAVAILSLRSNDGSQLPEPRLGVQFFPSDQPGKWRQDPISQSPIALGAYWGTVRPFVMRSARQFRTPTPPSLTSADNTTAYNQVKLIGGDGIVTPTVRTEEQTEIGIYWAYDGTPSLCAPPRLYNQIAMHIADQMGTTANASDLARLLALVNTSMADAAIAIWESKYFYQYWRPVTGIRESDAGTGPTGAGDGNPATMATKLFATWRTGKQSDRTEFPPAISIISVRPCRVRRRALPNPARLLPHRQHCLYFYLRRISMGRHATTPETCLRSCLAAFHHCRRQKKKTVRAEFTSAFIGSSIKLKASGRAVE